MKNSSVIQAFRPLLLIFVVTTGLFITLGSRFDSWGIDPDVVLAGNIVLIVATGLSFVLYRKSLLNNRAQVFLRMIYGGMFVKMFICLIGAFIYIVVAQKNVSKGAIFTLMGLYLLYSFVEISVLLKLSKQAQNG